MFGDHRRIPAKVLGRELEAQFLDGLQLLFRAGAFIVDIERDKARFVTDDVRYSRPRNTATQQQSYDHGPHGVEYMLSAESL